MTIDARRPRPRNMHGTYGMVMIWYKLHWHTLEYAFLNKLPSRPKTSCKDAVEVERNIIGYKQLVLNLARPHTLQ